MPINVFGHPLFILVFVFALLIRDYLNKTGYIKNLIGRLKTHYRRYRIRKARKRKREELKRQAEWQEFLRNGERVAVMVSRFSGGVADMLHSFPMWITITTTSEIADDTNAAHKSDEEALKDLIKRAVEVEDYENAAIYRDKLKEYYLAAQKQSNE